MSRWWSHRIVRAMTLLTVLATVGTVGYMAIEGWTFTDALFMAVVILSTVGLDAPHPLSAAGRAFTIVLIITGVSLAAYLVTALGEYVMGGVLTGVFQRRRLERAISRLSNHYVVCGYGRVGRQVVADLRRRGCPVVVIEREAAETGEAVPLLTGDATGDDILVRAGLMRARGLVAATGSDPTNVDITLSARAVNPALQIVARSSHPAAEPNLTRAGATYVVSPYSMGGHRIVSELLSPGITTFLDTVMHAEQLDLWLEVATIDAMSPLAGHTLRDALPQPKPAVNVVAMRQAAGGGYVTNPDLDARLAAGDTLVALGPQAAVQQLGARAMGKPGTPRPAAGPSTEKPHSPR
jgi:voltage-gated potassium channel